MKVAKAKDGGLIIYLNPEEVPYPLEDIEVLKGKKTIAIFLRLEHKEGEKDIIEGEKRRDFRESEAVEKSSPLSSLTKEELNLLMRLVSLPYHQREIKNLHNILPPKDVELMYKLVDRGFAHILYKQNSKYLGFSDEIYSELIRKKSSIPQKHDSHGTAKPLEFGFADYVIIKDMNEASKILNNLEEKNLTQEFRAITDLDGNVYIARASFLRRYGEKIKKFLDKRKKASVFEIAKALSMDVNAVKVVLMFLNEEAIVYEVNPKRGIYEVVE